MAETPLDRACRQVSPVMAMILRAVAARPGMKAREIADMVYRNDPTGGPEYARGAVIAAIWRNRQSLKGLGVQLVRPGRGFHQGYSIEFTHDLEVSVA